MEARLKVFASHGVVSLNGPGHRSARGGSRSIALLSSFGYQKHRDPANLITYLITLNGACVPTNARKMR